MQFDLSDDSSMIGKKTARTQSTQDARRTAFRHVYPRLSELPRPVVAEVGKIVGMKIGWCVRRPDVQAFAQQSVPGVSDASSDRIPSIDGQLLVRVASDRLV